MDCETVCYTKTRKISVSTGPTFQEYCTMWGPPSDVNVGLDSPQQQVSYLRTINHSEIGVMFTNLAIVWGPHFVAFLSSRNDSNIAISRFFRSFVTSFCVNLLSGQWWSANEHIQIHVDSIISAVQTTCFLRLADCPLVPDAALNSVFCSENSRIAYSWKVKCVQWNHMGNFYKICSGMISSRRITWNLNSSSLIWLVVSNIFYFP